MLSFKVVKKPLDPIKQMNIVRQSVLQATAPTMRLWKEQKEQASAKFEHAPKYQVRTYIRANTVTIVMLLTNSKQPVGERVTLGTIMTWVYETGTRPHIIRAKNARSLAFEGGVYQRKSGGGSGLSSSGQIILRKSVQHPGFAPSKELKYIDQRFESILRLAMDQGIRQGLERAKRG